MPLVLLTALYALIKVVTGTAVAALVYIFLKNTVEPVLNDLSQRILQQSGQLAGLDYVGGAISFLGIPSLIYLIVSVSTAAFSVRLMIFAFRAYGVKT